MKDKICFKIYAYETVEIKGSKGVPNKEEILNRNQGVHFNVGVTSEKKSKKIPLAKTRFNIDKTLRKSTFKSSKTITGFKDKDKDCLIF